ncbi:MAG: hypothetical protein LBV34_26785 [Nocardiopsaceae bacterium]|jgi:hypothetical protein|nr:hypothetical protein [Nocardiopsaceae bacterium]
MNAQFAAGRDFILRQGRVLERRLFATCFEGAPPAGVVSALRGYSNDDGGFGHGLEPDKRCPASLPIDVEVALQSLVAAGTTDDQLVGAACEYLAKVAAEADAGGAVPPAFPVIEGYPRAEHWTDWTYAPSVNPTAGLVGLLWRLGARHPWIDEAAAWCWSQIEGSALPDEVHALSEVFVFLAHAPERDRAEKAVGQVRDQLLSTSMFQLDPSAKGYGLSPLSIAPSADSRWRVLFSDEVINAHLNSLQHKQEADGGWPITWEPPSDASRLEWRGIVTLGALRTLTSYGRFTATTR